MALDHRERPAAAEPEGAVVFFHGFYGTPDDFVPFMDKIDPRRRLHAFLPRAPYEIGEGRSSWAKPGAEDLADADLAPVFAWLDSLPVAIDRCVLGGWSQGTTVAYCASFADGRKRPAGVLALGGRLPHHVALDLHAPLPSVLIAHGSQDDAVPVDDARAARDLLAGSRLTYLETGVGHEIDQAVVPQLRAFLERLP